MKNRFASVFDSAWCLKRVQASLQDRLAASRDRPGQPCGCFPGLLASPRRPRIRPSAAFWRPKAVLSASRRVSETASSAPNRPGSILRRLFIDFCLIFVDFKTIFIDFRSSRLRRRHKIRISKKSCVQAPTHIFSLSRARSHTLSLLVRSLVGATNQGLPRQSTIPT